MTGFIDPSAVEQTLSALLDDLNDYPDEYTDWEQTFLEGLEDYLEEYTCTDKQWKKLLEIAERHNL